MQTRSSNENSVCLSVKHMHYGKMEERFVQIFIQYERSFSLVFWEEEWLVGGDPMYWNCASFGPHWSEIGHFELIFTSAVTPSKKSLVNTTRKSTTRFPMSLRWSSYVASKPPLGAQKCKTSVFGVKLHFAWRKSATKFLCLQTVQKWLVGGDPFCLKLWVKLTALEWNRRFSLYFRS